MPLNAVKPVGVSLTSNAAQVAGLGRIYFELFLATDLLGFGRINELPSISRATILALDNSLFVLLYWLQHVCRRKKSVWPRFSEDFAGVHNRRDG